MHGPFYSLWEFDVVDATSLLEAVPSVLQTLQQRDGFVAGHVMRSPDESQRYAVHCTWTDVGSYRRALGSADAKMVVWPFLANMIDRPSAFECLIAADGNSITRFESSLGAEDNS